MTQPQIALKTEYFRGAVLAASTEEVRYNLNGVRVRVTKDGAWIDATDGHVLYTAFTPAPEDEDWSEYDCNVIIPSKAVKEAVKQAKKCEYIVFSFDGVTISLDDELTKPIDGTFPDVARVVPEGTSGEPHHFNPRLLNRVADMLNKSKKYYDRMNLHMNGPDPALCFGNDPNVLIVVMPMRGAPPTETAKAPDWAKQSR